jgi:hypothetical protein
MPLIETNPNPSDPVSGWLQEILPPGLIPQVAIATLTDIQNCTLPLSGIQLGIADPSGRNL